MIALLLLLLASVLVLTSTRLQAAPMVISMSVLVLAGTGYVFGPPEVAESRNAYSFGVLCIAAGYAAASVTWRDGTRRLLTSKAEPARTAVDLAFGRVLLLVVSIGSAYHFYKTGIVVLSADLETRRFDFLASGFFGLPSRLYLYGVPVAVAYLTGMKRIYRFSQTATTATALWRASVAVLVLTRLASGFKGALIEVITTLAIAELAARDLPLSKTIIRYAALTAGALVFAGVVASSYETTEARMSRTGASSTTDLLLDRLTIEAARPGSVVLASRGSDRLGIDGSSIANDLRHFRSLYFGGSNRSSFTLTERVSVKINDLPLNRRVFIVPTTVGLIPVLLFDFGVFGFLYCAIVGALYRAVERRVAHATLIRLAFGILCLMVLDSLLMRGNLVYLALNHLAFGALLLLGHPILGLATNRYAVNSGSSGRSLRHH